MNETLFLVCLAALVAAAITYLVYREIADRRIAKAQRLEEADGRSMMFLNAPARKAFYLRQASLARIERDMGTAATYERLADLVGYQEGLLN